MDDPCLPHAHSPATLHSWAVWRFKHPGWRYVAPLLIGCGGGAALAARPLLQHLQSPPTEAQAPAPWTGGGLPLVFYQAPVDDFDLRASDWSNVSPLGLPGFPAGSGDERPRPGHLLPPELSGPLASMGAMPPLPMLFTGPGMPPIATNGPATPPAGPPGPPASGTAPPSTNVPEPSSFLLLLTAGVGLALLRRRRTGKLA